MKKLKWIITAVGILCFVVGMIVLFNGANIGMIIAQKAIHANGGSMDTEQYHFIIQSNTLSYQLGGTVLSIVGGICAVIFGADSMK